MKLKITRNVSLLFLLLISILLMGIGYSSINSITGEINGTVIASVQDGIFITNVEYVSDIDADLTNSKIGYYKGTTMQTTVQLSSTNSLSEITYKITMYNNSTSFQLFSGVVYDDEFYDNEDLVYELNGINVGEIIGSKEYKEATITFKYKNSKIAENQKLNSYLKFEFGTKNRLMAATDTNEYSNYLNGTVSKNKIESIKFKVGDIPTDGVVSQFDASESQNESIIGYYTDVDSNDMYELTFVSSGLIYANTDSSNFFENLTKCKSIDFSNFYFDGVTSGFQMFLNCNSLTTLNLSKWDTSSLEDPGYMFENCTSLTSLDVSNWKTSKIYSMWEMFDNCSSLTELDLSSFDTSNVKFTNKLFYGCKNLKKLDLTNFDTQNVTDMGYMFSGCSNLSSITNIGKLNTAKTTVITNMFMDCSNITELDLSNWNTSKVTSAAYIFMNCSNITEIDLSKWDTSNITDVGYSFKGCSNLKTLKLDNWNTSKIHSMWETFMNCSSLTELDLSSFDTKNVKYMVRTFENCSSLNSLNISSFKTDSLIEASGMFYNCAKLTSVDISGWNTINLVKTDGMFSSTGLTTIYAKQYDETTKEGWTNQNITNSENMFVNSSSLVGGNGTKYNSEYIDVTYAVIDTDDTPGYFTAK